MFAVASSTRRQRMPSVATVNFKLDGITNQEKQKQEFITVKQGQNISGAEIKSLVDDDPVQFLCVIAKPHYACSLKELPRIIRSHKGTFHKK